MKRGDIWLVDLDPHIMTREIVRNRPVVIVSPEEFNAVTKLPLIVPVATVGSFARNNNFAVNLMTFGLQTTGVALCHQVRAIDLGARRPRFLERLPDDAVDEILAKVQPIFE